MSGGLTRLDERLQRP